MFGFTKPVICQRLNHGTISHVVCVALTNPLQLKLQTAKFGNPVLHVLQVLNGNVMSIAARLLWVLTQFKKPSDVFHRKAKITGMTDK